MTVSVVIQVCTDGSPLSDKAVQEAIAMAQKMQLPLVAVTVVSGKASGQDAVRARLTAIAQKAKEAGVPCELVAEQARAPYEGIIAVARRKHARLIVMASRGLGSIESVFLGSETQKVLASADRPVLVVR